MRRVLVVDDDFMVLNGWQRELKRLGWVVHKAANVQTARALLGVLEIDVVLTDYDLREERNGFDVVQACFDRNIEVVMQTGDPERAREHALAQFVPVLNKTDREQVLQALESAHGSAVRRRCG